MKKKPALRFVDRPGEYVYVPHGSDERSLIDDPEQGSYMGKKGIRIIGASRIRPGYRMERSSSQHGRLIYTCEGEATLMFDRGAVGQEIVLSQGSLFFAPAGSAYQIRTRKKWEFVWAHIYAKAENFDFLPKVIQVEPHSSFQSFSFLFESLWLEEHKQRLDAEFFKRSHVDLLVDYLKRDFQKKKDPVVAAWRGKLDAFLETMDRCRISDWTLEGVARSLGISKTALYHASMKIYGKPIMQVIRRAHLKRAAGLLTGTGASIQEVSERIGYADVFSFSKAFKQDLGLSPMQYRKKNDLP